MGAVEYFKAAYDLARKAQNVELQAQLMGAREEFNALQEETLRLRQRVAELEREREIQQAVEYKEPSYYLKKPDGTGDGPFCQRCYDVERRLVRTHQYESMLGVFRKCEQCKSEVSVSREHDPDPYRGMRGGRT
jgi:hypothetical protein